MDLCKLNKIIQDAGVGSNALGYAPELLEKIDSLDESKYSALLKQLASARDKGDFRGRVLEVNFAACFEKNGISLQYGAKQADCTGDIDFLWQLDSLNIYIELKHLLARPKYQENNWWAT